MKHSVNAVTAAVLERMQYAFQYAFMKLVVFAFPGLLHENWFNASPHQTLHFQNVTRIMREDILCRKIPCLDYIFVVDKFGQNSLLMSVLSVNCMSLCQVAKLYYKDKFSLKKAGAISMIKLFRWLYLGMISLSFSQGFHSTLRIYQVCIIYLFHRLFGTLCGHSFPVPLQPYSISIFITLPTV